MIGQKITHAARQRSLQEPPSQVLNDIRRVEIARAEYRLQLIRQAFAEDQAGTDVAFDADGISIARRNKGWEPTVDEGSEP